MGLYGSAHGWASMMHLRRCVAAVRCKHLHGQRRGISGGIL